MAYRLVDVDTGKLEQLATLLDTVNESEFDIGT